MPRQREHASTNNRIIPPIAPLVPEGHTYREAPVWPWWWWCCCGGQLCVTGRRAKWKNGPGMRRGEGGGGGGGAGGGGGQKGKRDEGDEGEA